MPATTLLVNTYDLKALGFVVTTVDHWSTPEKLYQTAEVPGRAGAVLLAAAPRVLGRTLTITGALMATTPALLATALDALKWRLDDGLLDLRLVDDVTRRSMGYLTRLVIEQADGRQFRRRHLLITMTFQVLDPYRQDVTASSVTFVTNTAMPLGTAPVRPALIRLSATVGTVTNPIVTYKNSAGTVLGTMDFTGASILNGDKIEIDCEGRRILKTVSVVQTDASNLLAAGDFLTLDPQDGDFTTSAWPTLTKASGGAGTLTALCQYAKHWL
jgi:phage-related protein